MSSILASPLPLDNSFWRFSLKVYRMPGVADECLALQNALEIDVNLLLFLAWLGASRQVLTTPDDLERARSIVAPWHTTAVRPLRALRLKLKEFGTPDTESYRLKVKTMELEAEQMEQAMLFAHAMSVWPNMGTAAPVEVTQRNIEQYLRMHSTPNKSSSTAALVDAASQVAQAAL